MSRRLLMLLSQNPLDPSGGAARTLDSICRLVSHAGWEVEALGTSATDFDDGRAAVDTLTMLKQSGLSPEVTAAADATVIRLTRDNIRYQLLDTGTWRTHRPHPLHGPRFDALYEEVLSRFRPDILLTFGAMHVERDRHRRAKRAGAKIVFSVQQHGYYDRRAFETVDEVLTCSEFLRQCYLERIGIDSTAIVSPLILDDVIATHHERVFITFVNPSVEKGVFFFARLAEELGRRRPDIPMLVVETRGTAGTLVAAGDTGGFDLRRHESLMVSPGVPMPRDIYAISRILLVPSVWAEPWGRVAAEAILNGIPPIVSDRGGLSEACGGGGFILPLPADLTVETHQPPPLHAVAAWYDLIVRLCDDEAAYGEACDRARAAADAFRPERLINRYVEYFDRVVSGSSGRKR